MDACLTGDAPDESQGGMKLRQRCGKGEICRY